MEFAATRIARRSPAGAWTKALLFALAGLLFAVNLAAQAPERVARSGDENIAVRLYADGMPRAGEEWMLALRFRPRGDEWHGYWSNPGDAGLGMRLELDLPEGWEVGEPLYPVPHTLTIAGLMNHIYEGDYAVLVPVGVPEDAVVETLPRVSGFVEYLACTDTICVPQDAVLEARQGGDFARWRAEIAPLLDATAAFAIEDDALRVAIPLPESVALSDPHVFVESARLVDYGGAQVFRRTGDT
ncbi:MAG: protein-disulfide reductase DsbD N-terminal domain-containing protein, partial [Erythrobacter sp.]